MEVPSRTEYLLKKIEIDGNSSTLLNFNKGLNIVTAPNGSGKTILWSIIKWTLGGKIKPNQNIDFISPSCTLSFFNNFSIFREKSMISITDSGEDYKLNTAKLHLELSERFLPYLENVTWKDFLDFTIFNTEKGQLTDLLRLNFTEAALKSNFFDIENGVKSGEPDSKEQLGSLINSLLEKSVNISKIDTLSLKTVLSTFLYFNLLNENELKTFNLELYNDLLADLKIIKKFKQTTKFSKKLWLRRFDFESITDDIKEFLLDALRRRNHKEINRLLDIFNIDEQMLSSGEIVLKRYILTTYILSRLNISFPLIIDEPFGRFEIRIKELLLEILSTLPQVIILCTKNTLPEIPTDFKVNIKHYENLFYETTLNLLNKFTSIAQKQKWSLTREYVQLGSQAYIPDYVIKIKSKKVLIEFKKEITTSIRLRLLDIIRNNEELYEVFIISPKTLLLGKFSHKLNKIITKEYPSHELDSILSKIQIGED